MDEDPLVAMDYGDLKLDGTKDNDDDDEDDEVAQNKWIILVAIGVKNLNLCCNLSSRERCECATSWMVSLLRRLCYRRGTVQSDGEPSIAAVKTVTLLAAPLVEFGFA